MRILSGARVRCFPPATGVSGPFSEAVHLASSIVIVALTVMACARSSEDSPRKAPASQPAWCSPPVASETWTRVPARDAEFSLRLPPSAQGVLGGTAQIWRTDFGTVGYSVVDRSSRWLDSASAQDTLGLLCQDTIAGRRVVIQYHAGREAYGPGHYLLAFWQLRQDEELDLVGFSRSLGGRDTILAIIRSVRFR